MDSDVFVGDGAQARTPGDPGALDTGELPAWMIEAHQSLDQRASHAPPPRNPKRWLIFAAVPLVLLIGFGVGLWFNASDIGLADEGEPEDRPALASTVLEGTGSAAFPDPSGLPVGEDADRMAIRIETPTDEEVAPTGSTDGATATVREDGRVYFEGSFRSQDEADRFIARASDVFGPEAVVEDYTINPDAAAPSAGDVVLDKPVLFEPGSAAIHPEYIPFLEACGDILKLNPQITLSIAAFTDSIGDEEFNLELSQRRAQAVVDFYATLDIDSAQLVGTGFGEDIPIADNESEDGRAENRRAMLQLLNVMGEEVSTDDSGE